MTQLTWNRKLISIIISVCTFYLVFRFIGEYCTENKYQPLSIHNRFENKDFHVKTMNDQQSTTVNQKTLKYIASHLGIEYEVTSNFGPSKQSVWFRNYGSEAIPRGNDIQWRIYFTTPLFANKFAFEEFHFKLTHVDGSLFSLEPKESFQGLQPGEAFEIHLNLGGTVSRYYIMPRWYVACPGESPYVIKSTDDDKIQFVLPFKNAKQWKRDRNDASSPFSLEERFQRYSIDEMDTAPTRVVPKPLISKLNTATGVVVNRRKWVVFYNPKVFQAEMQLLADFFGIEVLSEGEPFPSSHVISFAKGVVDDVIKSDEAYQINVNEERNTIEILANSQSGAYYAAQTLASLAEIDAGELAYKIPAGLIKDAPRYSYRGIQIDVARNFIESENLLGIIEVMGMYKLNKLHLHLTDDEGWRIEISGLPELTEVGSVRKHNENEEDALYPALGSGPFSNTSGTGYYSISDYKKILKVASANHIEVIPEIDLPGHAHAAIRAMETRDRRLNKSLQNKEIDDYLLSDPLDSSKTISIQHYRNNAVNPCMESTYRFVNHVINELKKMHEDVQPLKTVHLGGDEIPGGSWKHSPICQTFLKKNKEFPQNHADLSEYFIRRVSSLCNYHGLDLGLWEDGVQSSGNQPYKKSSLHNCNLTAYAWKNNWESPTAESAYKLANAGYKVVMSQSTHLYFDHPQEPDPEESGLTWATRYIDDKMVFGFKPDDLYANAEINKNGVKYTETQKRNIRKKHEALILSENIIGIQAQLWGELLRDISMVHHQLFPRVLAFAERAWHKASWENETEKIGKELREDDWSEFANTVGYKELPRLNKRGIHYRIPPPGVRYVEGKFQLCAVYPGLKFLFRPITDDDNADWLECRNGDPIPIQNDKYEFVTTDGARTSRIVQTE